MGNTPSIPFRNGHRRRNRLSKPPGNTVILKSINTQHTEPDDDLSASPDSIVSSPVVSIPAPADSAGLIWNRPTAHQTYSPSTLESETSPQVTFEVPDPRVCRLSRSNSEASVFTPRRASLMSRTSKSRSQLPSVPEHLRTLSLHSAPRRMSSVSRGNSRPEETLCCSCSLPKSRPPPVMRRKSLVTRPGVATRRPKEPGGGGVLSEKKKDDTEEDSYDLASKTTREPRWLRPSARDDKFLGPPAADITLSRAGTPNTCDYTHLGALKLGTLRIVNGSASPCPSERTSMPQSRTPSPEPKRGGRYTVQTHPSLDTKICQGTSTDSRIPNAATETITPVTPQDTGYSPMSPRSPGFFQPFPFEVSPIYSPLHPEETIDDDGIAHYDDYDYERVFDNNITTTNDNNYLARLRKASPGTWLASSSSLADSGYGSECSFLSLQGSQGRRLDNEDAADVCLFTERF